MFLYIISMHIIKPNVDMLLLMILTIKGKMRDQDQKKTLLKELVKVSKGLQLSNCSNMI